MTLSYIVAERVWRCTACGSAFTSGAEIDRHLVNEHNLELVWLAHGSSTIVDVNKAYDAYGALRRG